MPAKPLDVDRLITRMSGTPAALRALLAEVSPEDAGWKPASGAWSILEIVCHLCDEEELDFRARLETTIRDPAAPWPGIDPEGWATRHKYREQRLSERLSHFDQQRRQSLRWLTSLSNVNWHAEHLHPNFGPISLGTLMVSWAAHDALHVRQIAKRLYELAGRDGEALGFATKYAGEWKA